MRQHAVSDLLEQHTADLRLLVATLHHAAAARITCAAAITLQTPINGPSWHRAVEHSTLESRYRAVTLATELSCPNCPVHLHASAAGTLPQIQKVAQARDVADRRRACTASARTRSCMSMCVLDKKCIHGTTVSIVPGSMMVSTHGSLAYARSMT